MSKQIFDRLRQNAEAKANQSVLFRWYLQNHDAFAAAIGGFSRPGWDAVAVELQKVGLSKPDGSPITAEYARQTW